MLRKILNYTFQPHLKKKTQIIMFNYLIIILKLHFSSSIKHIQLTNENCSIKVLE